MRTALGSISLVLWAGAAQAESCPDFFRFVDFGLKDAGGQIHRGGAVFRAEDFEERPLLLRERTVCVEVREVSRDGRGNPIPVVARIEYQPAATGLPIEALSVAVMENPVARAEANAEAHRARLDRPGVKVARGETFLCAQDAGKQDISCQVVSPYGGAAPLVVHCGAGRCALPVLAINERLVVSAQWEAPEAALEAAGAEISSRIEAIHGFLTPLSSGL